jgi:hypothetical protein
VPVEDVMIESITAGSLIVHTRIINLPSAPTGDAGAQPQSVSAVHARLEAATPEVLNVATGVSVMSRLAMLDPPAPPPAPPPPSEPHAASGQGQGGSGSGGGSGGAGSTSGSVAVAISVAAAGTKPADTLPI